MPRRTTTGTATADSKTAEPSGKAAHTDTVRPLTPSPMLVCAPFTPESVSIVRLITDGAASASMIFTLVPVMAYPVSVPPPTETVSEPSATSSSLAVKVKSAVPEWAPAGMETLKDDEETV